MTSSPRPLLATFALLLLTFWTGCGSSSRELAGLAVAVDGIRSFGVRDGRTELVLTVRYHNETVLPVGIQSMEMKLELNGINVGKAVSKRPLGTQALSSNTQDITFTFDNDALVAQLREALTRGSVNYHLEAQLFVLSGSDELFARPKATGSIDVSGLTLRLN